MFSFAVQPALVPRYGFVAMAGFAPVIAWLVQGFSTRGLTIAAVVCVLLGSRQAAVLSDDLQRLDDDRVALLDMLRAESTDVPVVFCSQHVQ